MTMNTHFATSQRNDMRPLAFEGILATDCYAQLHEFIVQNAAFLRKRGLPDAAFFLAEPMCDAASGQIDWYTTATGTPTPIASLPPKEQTALRAKTDRCLAVLKALTESAVGKTTRWLPPCLPLPCGIPLNRTFMPLAQPLSLSTGDLEQARQPTAKTS